MNLVTKSQKGSFTKTCHTYPTMIKLGTVIPYLKEAKKRYELRNTPLSSADISFFSLEINKFHYIAKYGCRLHFSA